MDFPLKTLCAHESSSQELSHPCLTFGRGNLISLFPASPPPNLWGLPQSSPQKREMTNKSGLPRPQGDPFHLSAFPPVKWDNDTPPTHPEGGDSRPCFPAAGRKRPEAQASFILIIASLGRSRGPTWASCWHHVAPFQKTAGLPPA